MSELHRAKKAGAILDVPNFGEGHPIQLSRDRRFMCQLRGQSVQSASFSKPSLTRANSPDRRSSRYAG